MKYTVKPALALLLLACVGCSSRPQPVAVDAKAVTADDLRAGCARGEVFNVSGIVAKEQTSVAGEPIAEMKTSDSEFKLRLGFPGRGPSGSRAEYDSGILGIYAGAQVAVQGTCSVSVPGTLVVLREAKIIR
jgi:hypothetical protein